MIPAGDTYLDMHTMLADKHQKTFTISLTEWETKKSDFAIVSEFPARDESVICIQIWPFCANDLNAFQMAIAVAMSYTHAELIAESRISSALDDLVNPYGFFADDFE